MLIVQNGALPRIFAVLLGSRIESYLDRLRLSRNEELEIGNVIFTRFENDRCRSPALEQHRPPEITGVETMYFGGEARSNRTLDFGILR